VGIWSRITQPFRRKSASGAGYFLSDGWLPPGSAWNWWQTGGKLQPYSSASAMVEACVGAYSQTVAMCPGDHWRITPNGGRERVSNSALSRILRKPNEYQSISDFLLNLTRSLYDDGNAYALALRNDRYEIAELHLMRPRSCFARVAEGGEVFYALGGNEIIDRRIGGLAAVPARDVLHVRLHTPRDPLRGESPIVAAALNVAAGNAALQQQLAFFLNQARPSMMLSTDQVLTLDQVRALRAAWDEQTKGVNAGGTPILSAGLKPHTASTTADDAQLVETLKMSDQNVALAFRVPLQVLGLGGTTYASTELMMQSWIASGLGFALNHIEEAFGRLFQLRGVPDEYVEFDTNALLRSSFKERVDALSSGTHRVYTINEARAIEGLPAVEGGDEVRVQQQDVPLTAWEKSQIANPASPALPAPAAPANNDNADAEAAKALLKIYKGLS
jgi:HK97 family phage portal protein